MLQVQQILQDRYQIQRQLGDNSIRQTWLARDLQAEDGEKLVVVKLLAFGGSVQWDDLKLFEREAQILQQLKHPRIPKYVDYFCIDDHSLWFGLVQEYIPGESLKEKLTQGQRFTEKQVRKFAAEILNILIHLHQLNPQVLHRDIKPSNLIWGEDGSIYLIDFGAVQDKAAKEGVTFTVVGTYGYAPMEQFGGRAVPASDLYALGATLIHLLTGIPPADLPLEDLRMQFSDKVNVSPSLVHWLEQLIEPSVERRIKTAGEALEELNANRLRKSILGKIRQPANSLVELKKNPKQLSIKLPQKSRSSIEIFEATFGLAVFLAIALMIMLGVLSIFIIPAPLIALGILLFFCLFLWIITDSLLLSAFGHQRICMTKDFFAIELWLFNFCRKSTIGQTADIRDVFQSVLQLGTEGNFDLQSQLEKEMVTIQTGDRRYSFGVGLSAIECVWLAQEIKDWLRGNS